MEKQGKKRPDYVKYLWDDLKPEEQELLLQEAAKRLAKRKKPVQAKIVSKFRPWEVPDEVIQECVGLDLDDGYLRVCATSKYETFILNVSERFADDWLKVYSKQYKATKAMKIWPYKMRSKANPFKWPSIIEVQLLPVVWFEAYQQYRVTFEFGPGVTETFWFPPEFLDSELGGGWVRPRKLSRTVPWSKKPKR